MSAGTEARLALAFPEPPEAPSLLLGAPANLPIDRFAPGSLAVQTDAAAHAALARAGWRAAVAPEEGPYQDAVVFLTRSRAAQRAQVAEAARRLPAGGALWVDGQKSEGIETMLRDLRALALVDPLFSKAHGKLFRVTIPQGEWLPADWTATESCVAEGFVTRPGVFSADGPDPASVLLAQALPPRMPTRVVDLGAGWGWLAAQVLAREGVEVLHLVEADHEALTCARRNVIDPRVQFHWADALTFRLPEPVNGVVMNPPFHSAGGQADPRLGAGFIRAAAGLLTGAGRLWMVANRHLPYEAELASHFRQVEEIGGNGAFKVITATGARRN